RFSRDWSSDVCSSDLDFENEGGETYICGNPPYLGSVYQTGEQKAEMKVVFDKETKAWKSLDYVAAWFQKAAEYGTRTNTAAAFRSEERRVGKEGRARG